MKTSHMIFRFALPGIASGSARSSHLATLVCLLILLCFTGAHSLAQSPPVAQKHNPQAQAYRDKGIALAGQNDWNKAITEFQAAYELDKASHPDDAAADLYDIGLCDNSLSQYEKAITYYQQALPIYQQVKDIHGQAKDLHNLGHAYYELSQYDKAITYYQQALALDKQVKDIHGQARDLNNLGNAYLSLNQYDKAIQFYQQALPIFQQVKDIHGQANNLNNLGIAYEDLSQFDKAIQFYQQALTLDKQIKDLDGQATDLGSLGIAYKSLSQYEKAITLYQQALTLNKKVKDLEGQAADLNNLGNAYLSLNQYDKAITLYQQALPIFQQVKDIHGQARDFGNLGNAYKSLSQYDKAIQYYQQALPIFQQVKDRDGQANDLDNLMLVWQKWETPALAIFYGKQSVNVYQSIRQDINSMDKDTQKTYLKAKEPTYRQLAELLIQQGRLPEAEQVLGLLKDQEFFDFVRRDPSSAPAAGAATLTPLETTWQARYQVIADQITAIGLTKQDLLTRQQQAAKGEITLTTKGKTDLQNSLTQTDADLTVANKAFQDFLTQLAAEAQTAPKAAQDRVETVTEATAFEDTLRQLGPGTVALYTIVEPDKVRILVVTSQTQVAREYPIKDTDLREKVEAFRKALQLPDVDPRPYAHDLYQILVGPIEKDLQGVKATTLMWSLDDVLRYLPMAALYDGKQYLVERYQDEVFTPASVGRLTDTPQAQWNGLGLGVSLAHPGFIALGGVPQELDDVIHDPAISASQTGALPGTILLDTAFTQQAMTQALEGHGYPLVHIASHFDFEPGDETNSFLLLGDGSHLSLADIKTLPQVFQGVDLLTLSACDTANGSGAGADGREVEGFAVLAQREGAKAVIASLWPVADASTPLLMETFYKQHAAAPNQSKAEALCLAQLSLLHGTVSAPGGAIRGAQVVPDKKDKAATNALPFMPDPKAPYAHPYYWAPFILIGNWK